MHRTSQEMQTISQARRPSAEVLPSSRKSGICWYGSNVTVIWRNSLPWCGERQRFTISSDPRKGTNKEKQASYIVPKEFSKHPCLNLVAPLKSTTLLWAQGAEVHCGQFGQAGTKVITYGFLGSIRRHKMGKKNTGFDTFGLVKTWNTIS